MRFQNNVSSGYLPVTYVDVSFSVMIDDVLAQERLRTVKNISPAERPKSCFSLGIVFVFCRLLLYDIPTNYKDILLYVELSPLRNLRNSTFSKWPPFFVPKVLKSL